MSRRSLYYIVILCTVCCISIMIYYETIYLKNTFNTTSLNNRKSIEKVRALMKEDSEDIKKNENSKCDENKNKIEKNKPVLNTIESSNKYNEPENEINSDYNRIKDINELEENLEEKIGGDIEGKKEVKYDNIKKDRKKEFKENTNISVFKTNKNTILNKISFRNKVKTLKILSKLPKSEHKTLIKHIKRGDELEAAKDILIILKNNLSEEELNDIKIIFNPHINIDMIERSIV